MRGHGAAAARADAWRAAAVEEAAHAGKEQMIGVCVVEQPGAPVHFLCVCARVDAGAGRERQERKKKVSGWWWSGRDLTHKKNTLRALALAPPVGAGRTHPHPPPPPPYTHTRVARVRGSHQPPKWGLHPRAPPAPSPWRRKWEGEGRTTGAAARRVGGHPHPATTSHLIAGAGAWI
jgi:hypothetical protein